MKRKLKIQINLRTLKKPCETPGTKKKKKL